MFVFPAFGWKIRTWNELRSILANETPIGSHAALARLRLRHGRFGSFGGVSCHDLRIKRESSAFVVGRSGSGRSKSPHENPTRMAGEFKVRTKTVIANRSAWIAHRNRATVIDTDVAVCIIKTLRRSWIIHQTTTVYVWGEMHQNNKIRKWIKKLYCVRCVI